MNTSAAARVSRREFLGVAAIAAGSCLVEPASRALAQVEGEPSSGSPVPKWRAAAASVTIDTRAVHAGVHVLVGSGGNIGVLAGDDGLLLVDTGLAGSQPQITKALAELSRQPLKHVVSTHWHFDHCDGNAWTRAAGATLLAHPNTRKHLSQTSRVPAWDFTFPPTPEEALPNELVEDAHELKLNGGVVAIHAYGFGCHTDGDLYVHFPDADVLQTGDTFWNGHYPFIDTTHGGSIDGTLRATEVNLGLVGAQTQIIPGHGPIAGRAELTEFRDMLADVRDAVAKLKREGKTMEEAIAAKPTEKWDAKYAGFAVTPEGFTRIVYAGV